MSDTAKIASLILHLTHPEAIQDHHKPVIDEAAHIAAEHLKAHGIEASHHHVHGHHVRHHHDEHAHHEHFHQHPETKPAE